MPTSSQSACSASKDTISATALTEPELPAALQARLQACSTLPSLPDVVMRVIALAKAPDTSLHELARCLERDPALTLRLLSLANSVFHSQAREVASCLEAVSRLGIDATLSVALGFGLAQRRDSSEATRLDLDHFWQRALISALAGHRLAMQTGRPDAGSVFTIALLQDIGMLALDTAASDIYGDIVSDTHDHAVIIERERQLLGCDHALVGAWLAERWGLPERLVDGIAASHGSFDTQPPRDGCIIAAALIADAWLSTTPAHLFAELLPSLPQHLDLDTANLRELITTLQDDLPTIAQLFEITLPPGFDAQQLLLEAKQVLHAHNQRLNAQLLTQCQEMERLRNHQAQLDRRIRFDALTGLYNRAYLEELLEAHFLSARKKRTSLAVVFIDLDHFKRLNDCHGHRLGDEVLQNFAELLRGQLCDRVQGGRYGGEEFLLILPETSQEFAVLVAETLCRRLADTPMAWLDGEPVHVTASLGIAHMEGDDYDNARDLIHAADQGMYMAKRGGRARIAHFNPATGSPQ
ncbi:sensor domain-containing diguanylate cyclase [Litchfieldella rifensis]|uniref:diguanylate cyclase n=1 Tax=Litchfieldella rifensis TaxID=762643 RepID=A0ABV7LS01_9GAMM